MTEEEIDNLKKEKAKLEADMQEYRERVYLEDQVANLKRKKVMQKIKKKLGIFRVWGVIFKFCWGVCWKVIKGIFVYMQKAAQNYQMAMDRQAKELEKKQGEKKE